MEETIPPTRRRGFLRGTLAFVGGVFGLSAAGSDPAPAAPAPRGNRLRFYVRSRSLNTPPVGTGAPSIDRRTRRGALLAKPDGDPVGEYYATCLSQPGAFGVQLAESPAVELQTFRLPDGTLFGAGANEHDASGASLHALLGGTGRYAGVRGIYKLTPVPRDGRTEDWVELEINLLA